MALGLFRAFSFGLLRWRRFHLGFGLGGSYSRVLGTVQLILQLFVQPEGLPPAIQLVPRLLRFLFVRAKIQSNITMSHKTSLRRTALEVKMAPRAKVRVGHIPGS